MSAFASRAALRATDSGGRRQAHRYMTSTDVEVFNHIHGDDREISPNVRYLARQQDEFSVAPEQARSGKAGMFKTRSHGEDSPRKGDRLAFAPMIIKPGPRASRQRLAAAFARWIGDAATRRVNDGAAGCGHERRTSGEARSQPLEKIKAFESSGVRSIVIAMGPWGRPRGAASKGGWKRRPSISWKSKTRSPSGAARATRKSGLGTRARSTSTVAPLHLATRSVHQDAASW